MPTLYECFLWIKVALFLLSSDINVDQWYEIMKTLMNFFAA